jgi:hypothetical protein
LTALEFELGPHTSQTGTLTSRIRDLRSLEKKELPKSKEPRGKSLGRQVLKRHNAGGWDGLEGHAGSSEVTTEL